MNATRPQAGNLAYFLTFIESADHLLRRRLPFRVTLLPIAATAIVMLPGCSSRGPPVQYQFTLTLREAGKLYTGSSITQVNPEVSNGLLSGKIYSANLRGTATFVELPNGRMAAALLGAWGRDNFQEPFAYLRGEPGPIHLTRNQQPTIIVFADPAKPASYELMQKNDQPSDDRGGIEVVDAELRVTAARPGMKLPDKLKWVLTLPLSSSNIIDGSNGSSDPKHYVQKQEIMSGG